MNVGIIGAGLAGLACADGLRAAGHDVTLFDKARGPGGRMSTRRIATPLGEAAFDHGAQYFTVRDLRFRAVVDDWAARGLARQWETAGPETWIGVPAMNAVAKDMASRYRGHYGCLVQGIIRLGHAWGLIGVDVPDAAFDAVIVAVPAEQAAPLVGPHDLALARLALSARSQPCWTAMFAFAAPLDTDAVILRDAGVIGWAARNSVKPGREGPEAWVVQANGAWSSQQIRSSETDIKALLCEQLAYALKLTTLTPVASAAHLWRYALSSGSGDSALWNADIQLGLCGDWLLGPRVECAWLSGRTLASKMTLR